MFVRCLLGLCEVFVRSSLGPCEVVVCYLCVICEVFVKCLCAQRCLEPRGVPFLGNLVNLVGHCELTR